MIKVNQTAIASVHATGAVYAGTNVFAAPEVFGAKAPLRAGMGVGPIALVIIAILTLTLS